MNETGRVKEPTSEFYPIFCSTQKAIGTRSAISDAESVVDLVESEEEGVVDLLNDDDQETGLQLESDELSGNVSEIMDDSSTAESLQQETLINNVNLSSMHETLPFPSTLCPLFETCKGFLERKFGVGIEIQTNNMQNQLLLSNTDSTLVAVAKLELQHLIDHPQTLTDELHTLQRQKIHIFVDESNILLGAKSLSQHIHPPIMDPSIQLLPTPLLHLISNQRTVVEKVLFGSHKKNTPEPALWHQWRALGFTVHTQMRDKKESFLDDALVGMILSTLGKFSLSASSTSTSTATDTAIDTSNSNRRTLVLLTGDGNDNHQRASFVEAVHLALRQGWQVELWCWRASVSRHYLNMQREYAYSGLLSVHYLDEFRSVITTAAVAGRRCPKEERIRTDRHHRKRPLSHQHQQNGNSGREGTTSLHHRNHNSNNTNSNNNANTNSNTNTNSNSNTNGNADSQQTHRDNHRNDRRWRRHRRKRQRCN